jgi:hypothetical protein
MTTRLISQAKDAVSRFGRMAIRDTVIYDEFDVPDGTDLNGLTTPTGHVWIVNEAAGGQPFLVNGGKAASASNTYNSLNYGKPVKRYAAAFSFLPVPGGSGDRTNAAFTIILAPNSSTQSLQYRFITFLFTLMALSCRKRQLDHLV